MRKSLAKRIRVTKNGKIVRRPMGVDHFRTRQTAKRIRGKRQTRSITYSSKKLLSY